MTLIINRELTDELVAHVLALGFKRLHHVGFANGLPIFEGVLP